MNAPQKSALHLSAVRLIRPQCRCVSVPAPVWGLSNRFGLHASGCRDHAKAQARHAAGAAAPRLSVVPDGAKANIKKLPPISHKAAANGNDAFAVLAA
jgi:hypothetical protein